MSAYLVCMVRVDDPERYRQYTAKTPALIQKYGGRFVVRGGPVEAIEGPEFGDRLVIVEFPSKEAAKKFYDSPEYREAMTHRTASAESRFFLAEGVPEGVVAPDDQVVESS